MESRSYNTIDKTGWGDGPWQSEPDKMQWRDEATGFACLIVRWPVGALCGYVGVPKMHQVYGLSCDGTPDAEHRAHSKAVREKMRSAFKSHEGDAAARHEAVWETLGDDWPERPEIVPGVGERITEINVHGGLTFSGECQKGDDPADGICHVPEHGEPDDVWWFGFDCAHASDLCPQMEMHRREITDKMPPMPEALRQYQEEHPDIYRDVPYVQAEVAELAKQIAAIHA